MNEHSCHRISCLIPAAVVIFSGFLSSCGASFSPVFPGYAWERATPESQGIASSGLLAMMEDVTIRRDDIDAIVLVRNGRIVFNAYRSPFSPEMQHRIYSCTKSVNSLLVGMAIDSGTIAGIDAGMNELFPSLDAKVASGISEDLTLEHLLTMTAGLDARDSYRFNWSGLHELLGSDDPTAFALSRSQIRTPGEFFEYSNQASYLLGAAVTEAVGIPVNAWAEEVLFAPLGIGPHRWDLLKGGEANTWGGLWLTAEDLARLGLLITRNGRWKGERIVSKTWLKKSVSPKVEGRDLNDHYGYQWWISDDGIPMAQGYAGQYLMIVPHQDLVMVVLSSLPEHQFHIPQELLRSHVLPALSSEPLPEDSESLAQLRVISDAWNIRYNLPDTGTARSGGLAPDVSGTRFELEPNDRGLVAVSFTEDNSGTTVAAEEYNGYQIRFLVGMDGEYLTTEFDNLSYAMAGHWTPTGLRMREYGLGQAYRNDYHVQFGEDGTVLILIEDSAGRRDILRGSPEND